METKGVVKVCLILILAIILFFIYYLIFIKPYIVGEYTATKKDCKNSYNCDCLKDECVCTYSKWFKENKVMCDKEILKKEQIK